MEQNQKEGRVSRFLEELNTQIEHIGSTPFLFAGAGLSIRYIGAPSWNGLLTEMCKYTRKGFHQYRIDAGDQYPKIGTLMSEDFYRIWCNDDSWARERNLYLDKMANKSSPLKLRICNFLGNLDLDSVFTEANQYHKEVQLLQNSNLEGIITTNYDVFLEKLFPEYKVYVGQQDLIFSRSYTTGEIYKIHGCQRDFDSLVLCDDDYEYFNEKNKYLASKLITIFMEHPIFFMGYSMQDINIQKIFETISDCLNDVQLEKLSSRLFFISWEKDCVEPRIESKHYFRFTNKSIFVTKVVVSDFSPIYEIFSKLRRKIPVDMMRRLKDQLYELVRTNDPKNKICVVDMDDMDNMEELDFVIGLGVQDKLNHDEHNKDVQSESLFEDVIQANSNFNEQAENIVNFVINNWLQIRNRKFIPVYRYLRMGGWISDDGRMTDKTIPNNIQRVIAMKIEDYQTSSLKRIEAQVKEMRLPDVVAKYGEKLTLGYAPFCNLSADELIDFITNNLDYLRNGTGMDRGSMKKLICLYDKLKYGPLVSETI